MEKNTKCLGTELAKKLKNCLEYYENCTKKLFLFYNDFKYAFNEEFYDYKKKDENNIICTKKQDEEDFIYLDKSF